MNMLDMGMPQLPGEKKGIEFREILSIIWRRKWLIFIPVITALVFGVLLCRFLPKKYTSTAYIHFGRPEYAVERSTRDAVISHQTAFKERARKLEIDVTQPSVLRPVFVKEKLIDPNLPLSLYGRVKGYLFGLDIGETASVDEQYEEARNNLLIEFREDQPIIKIEYTATNRVVAARVCDEIANLLFEKDRESGKILVEQKEIYEQRFNLAKRALQDQKKEIKDLVAEAQKEEAMPERLNHMSRRLDSVSADIRMLEDKISRDSGTYAILAMKVQSLDRTVEIAKKKDSADMEIEGQLARDRLKEYEDYMEDMAKAYGRYHWKVEEIRKKLKSIRKEAAIENKKLEALPIKLPALRADRADLRKKIDEKNKAVQKKVKRREEIQAEIDKDATLEDNLKMDSDRMSELREELGKITEEEEPALKKERNKAAGKLNKVLEELEEYETLAELSGYIDEDITSIEEVTESVEDEPDEGEGTGSFIEKELQNEKIRKILKKLFPGKIPANLNPDWLDALVNLVSLEVSMRMDKNRISELEKTRDDLQDRVLGAFANQTALKRMQETQKELTDEYERARERYELAESQKMLFERSRGIGTGGRGNEGAYVKKFNALMPLVHSSPQFGLIILLTGVGGLALGGALALVVEMADHTVKRPTDLSRIIDRPVLAAIPSLDIGRFHTPENLFFRTKRAVEADLESGVLYDKNYVKEIRYRSIATEQIRKLRLRMNTPEGEKIRTILVTSALAGEGKSTVAANLAVAISQMIGEYVMLIDGDLRRPDLHNFFGLPPKPGLSEYLENDLDLAQLLVKTDFDKLTLLQAGKVPANSTELLSSDKMHRFIREVKSRYSDRYVILDSPPVLSTSEPNILGSQVDGIVLVVRAGMTPREMVEDVLLSLNPDKVMGVVMNDVHSTVGGKYYSPTYA